MLMQSTVSVNNINMVFSVGDHVLNKVLR